jgi:hypothetical protein
MGLRGLFSRRCFLWRFYSHKLLGQRTGDRSSEFAAKGLSRRVGRYAGQRVVVGAVGYPATNGA